MAPFTKENFACHFISENYCSRALRSKICCSRTFCVRDDHWWSPQFYIKPFWCTKWFEVVALVFTLGECEIPKIQAQAQLLPHMGPSFFCEWSTALALPYALAPWMELTWTHTCNNYMLLKLVVVIRACWSWWAHTCIWRSKSYHCQSPPLLGTSLL